MRLFCLFLLFQLSISIPNPVLLGQEKSTIELIDGRTIDANISAINVDGSLAGDNVPEDLSIDQILTVSTNKKASRPASGTAIQLVDGGLIYTNRVEIADESVKFSSTIGIDKLPLETLRAVVWNRTAKVAEAIKSPSPDKDVVIVETPNGEQLVSGLLESVSTEQIKINYQGKSRNITFAKVKVNAIVIADLKLKKRDGTAVQLALTDGSSIHGILESLLDDQFSIQLTGGTNVKINRSIVSSIKVTSGNLVFLSDLEPVETQQKSVFTLQRQWKRDLSIEGNPLTLRFPSINKTQGFKKGLGTQSYSSIVFENDGEFNRFIALAGIDAETQGRGDCMMVVRGDGTNLWSKRIRATEDPVDVSVDITGVKQVALIVQPGEQFDLSDHADWINARFTKTK